MALTIDELQIEISSESTQAVDGLEALTDTLAKLKVAARGGVGLTTVANQIKRLNEAVKGLQDPSLKIQNLVRALKPLESIGKSNLNSTINSLKKLPDITKQLSDIDMGAFENQINRVVQAIKPLADEMNKVAAGFSAFPSRIQKLITQNERLSISNKKVARSYTSIWNPLTGIIAKTSLYTFAIRKVSNIVSGWVIESNDYVENLNLFRVSMRDAADEALDFAYKVKDAFGVDPSEWIRFQAVFQNMYTGFGVASDKATIMSKTLTQFGYDLATIFNVDYSIAMEKLQSAIAGQPRPMREWGFDMSEATLKLVAMKHGIEGNVETMTQFEKSQLRFVQLMETAKNQGILGNFAREIHTPANAFRILNQQLRLFKRELGNMIIPLLMKIVPYLQAIVRLLTEFVHNLAILFKFSLPKIDYSGIDGLRVGAEGAVDALDDATSAARRLKNATAGFDELNVISPETGGTSQATGVGTGDLGIDFSAYNYDFIGKLGNRVDEIAEKLKEPFEKILKTSIVIGVIIASWRVSDALYTLFTTGLGGTILPKIAEWLGNITRALFGMATGSSAAASAFTFLTEGSTAASIGAIAGVLVIIVTRFVDLYKNSETFRKGLERLKEVAGNVFGFVKKLLTPLIDLLSSIAQEIANLIPEGVKKAIKEFFNQFDLDWKDVGISALGFALLFIPGGQVLGVILLGFEAITLAIRGLGSISDETWEEIKKWFNEGIEQVKEWFTNMLINIGEFFVNTWDGIKATWGVATEWFSTTVIIPIQTTFDTAISTIGGFFSNLWTGIHDTFEGVSKWFKMNVTEPISGSFKTAMESVRTLLNKFIDWVNSKLHFDFEGLEILGKTVIPPFSFQLFTLPKIPAFKSGGFPDTGQMFIAREAGAEMVGAIGSKTTVANNQQIVEGISQGVYQAVKAAMSGSDEQPLEVRVYLDGKEITRSVEKVQRERGISILEGGVVFG